MLTIQRCLTIGRCHAVRGDFKNALALYARSLDLSSSVLSVKSAVTSEPDTALPKMAIPLGQLQSFHRYIDGTVSQYRALVELRALMSQQKASARDVYRPPLVERLDDYPIEEIDLTKLVNFPPKLQPVPVKPLFFDLAWNYIQYPGHAPTDANEAPAPSVMIAEERKEPAKKGWFGFGR